MLTIVIGIISLVIVIITIYSYMKLKVRKDMVSAQKELEKIKRGKPDTTSLINLFIHSGSKYLYYLEKGADVAEYKQLTVLTFRALAKRLGGGTPKALLKYSKNNEKINDKQLKELLKKWEKQHPEWLDDNDNKKGKEK